LEVPWPPHFLAISGFTNHQCLLDNVPWTEILTHSAEIFSEVPIGGELGLPEVDRAFRRRAKRSISAWRGDVPHLRGLQEYKLEKFPFYEPR
jgi:hypothetical protein